MIASHLAPKRSNNHPVIGFISPMIIAPGSKTNPDSNAVKSSMFCISNGKITPVPIIEINTIMPSAVDNVNILYLKILNSKIGCSNLSWRVINRNNDRAPTTKDMPTCKLIQPERSEEHTSELQSRGHLVCRLLLEKKKT